MDFGMASTSNSMGTRTGFIRYSPNEIEKIMKEETKQRRELRVKQVRDKEKKRAEELRDKFEKKKQQQALDSAIEEKYARLEQAKQDLERLKQMRRAVLHSSMQTNGAHSSSVVNDLGTVEDMTENVTVTLTGLDAEDSAIGDFSDRPTLSIPSVTAGKPIPNTAFGLGFYRCEEMREASHIQEFSEKYREEQRMKERKERFKRAYSEEVKSEAQKAELKRLQEIQKQEQIELMNRRRLSKLKKQAKKFQASTLGDEADKIIMCQDNHGYVDFSQTRFHVVDNSNDLQGQYEEKTTPRS